MPSKVLLPSRPSGWYFLGFPHEFPPGAVATRRILGRDIVVFRTRAGEIAALDPFCPHMGAHLGHGGVVEAETLRCPFHAFRFDGQGRCVAGYGTQPPPKATLRSWPLQEVNGFLFVYYDEAGKAPSWYLEAIETSGWTPPVSYAWDLSCHPQDIGENAVDIGHLRIVHGYEPLEVLSPLASDGPRFQVSYRLHRSATDLFLKMGRMTVELTIHGYGLGYAHTEITIPAYGIRFRNYTLVTPTEAGRTTLRVAISLERVARPHRINPVLALVPAALLNRLIARILLLGVIRDVGHDVAILQHRSWVHPPALAKGDGPIAQFRSWAAQFAAP